MKKILICCVTITLLLCLFSCDVSQNSSHSHSFHSSWEYDGNAHWHKCECSEKSEYASHEFGDWYSSFQNTEMNLIERICTVCGYREEKEVPIHQHSYFENFDAQFHWSECACRNITSKNIKKTIPRRMIWSKTKLQIVKTN